MTNKSNETKVRIMDDENTPHYSKVNKVYVTNQSEGGGGGEFDGTVPWESVTSKPQLFPPTAHDHDERYHTKEESEGHVNFVRDLMEQEQGKVATHAGDDLGYLDSKLDNATIVVENNELRVKGIDGLTVGVADISAWLSGTEENIQTQLDDIGDTLTALSAGMRYIGRFEDKATLLSVGNKNNGDLAVVIADESRTGGRSMYVYSEGLDVWEFIGEFTFTDAFTALKDTPSNYVGADGKVAKVSGERIVFDDVNYADVAGKPSSTITQIDDAVAKRHEHGNADSLAKLGINEDGELTINGVVYTPKSAIQVPKEYLYVRRSDTDQSIGTNTTLRFDNIVTGNIPYDPEFGTFELKAGKTYEVTANLTIISPNGQVQVQLIDNESNQPPIGGGATTFISPVNMSNNFSSGGVLNCIITPQTTQRFKVRTHETRGASGALLYRYASGLVVKEL